MHWTHEKILYNIRLIVTSLKKKLLFFCIKITMDPRHQITKRKAYMYITTVLLKETIGLEN